MKIEKDSLTRDKLLNILYTIKTSKSLLKDLFAFNFLEEFYEPYDCPALHWAKWAYLDLKSFHFLIKYFLSTYVSLLIPQKKS